MQPTGQLTFDRHHKTGHFQGTHHSEVYREGKVYVYTAWSDNEDEVGKDMPFEEWLASVRR